MTISYHVAIDRDDDGDFAGSGEDITADVLLLEWKLGMQQAHDSMAQAGTARITVRNVDQAYSPEVTSLQPGQVIRIQSDDGSTVRTHFTGHIAAVEPQPGEQGQRRAVIHAVDALWQLQQHTIRLPPQVNVRADAVIEQILDRVPFRRTRLKGYWVLGKTDHSELGSNTRLPIRNIERALETGETQFAYVGDTWGDGIPAYEAIREVVVAERGHFLLDRSGQAVFYNRHHLLRDATSTASFADDMAGLAYDYGTEVISQVQVMLLPRHTGSAGSVLWQLDGPQLIPAQGEVQLLARFRDDEQRPIGALTLLLPVPGLDFEANRQPDGSGQDGTGSLDVSLRVVDFSAALLEIRSRAKRDLYLLAGARLRGTPLFTGDPLMIERFSYGSLAFYSPRTLRFDLPALDSVAQAESLARYELARRKSPRGYAHRLTLSIRQHPTQVLARTLLDRITIEEAQTGHVADYFIVAEAHRVDLGGSHHQVAWTLESAHANTFWLLNHSRLNADTVLAY